MSKKKKKKYNSKNDSSKNKEVNNQVTLDTKPKKVLDGLDLIAEENEETKEENKIVEVNKPLSVKDLEEREVNKNLESTFQENDHSFKESSLENYSKKQAESKLEKEDEKISSLIKEKEEDHIVELKNRQETIEERKEENLKKTANLNERIQTFTSIFFTIIIFIALLLLIFVLYNNYIKKGNTEKFDVNEVCKDYIKKDYHIELASVSNFIKNYRGILYNIDTFDDKNLTNNDLLTFATYYIWSVDSTYLPCDEEDSFCLTTKKEIKLENLKEELKKFLNVSNLSFSFPTDFKEEDDVRLYLKEDKVILTFSEFTYQTLKHDLIETRIDEDKVYILFALSKQIENSDAYSYVGYKKVVLQFKEDRFLVKSIETSRK